MGLYQANHLGNRGSSLVEIMAMMAILGLAVTAMFSTIIGGIYFATDSENRIKAINIAREGLEGVTNIRNTNWLRFSSDQLNCWRILDYNATCIGSGASLNTNGFSGNYIIENKNGAWYLTGATSGSGLWIDTNGYYYANGDVGGRLCTFEVTTDCISPFTREINVLVGSNSGIITVTSKVDWFERRPQNITISTTLTNWKSKF